MNETRIVELRRERGWTQERLAEASGITVRTVQRLEAGNDASLETLSLVAGAFEVPVRELFADVAEDDYGKTVSALDARAERQQERRDRMTDGLRALYRGVGVILTLAIAFAIAARGLSGLSMLIIAAYWTGGRRVASFLYAAVIGPRLDRELPLSRERARRRTPCSTPERPRR